MADRPYPLARLRARERRAIDLLRGANRAGTPMASDGDFERLRLMAAANGMTVRAVGMPYVGQDERRILALLAAFQRVTPGVPSGIGAEMRGSLLICAAHIEAEVGRLDYRSSLALVPDLCPAVSESRDTVRLTPYQHRILDLVRRRGTVSATELYRARITREMIVLLHRRGALQRVGPAVYAVREAR